VRLYQGGSVSPACRAGLVESLVDFTIPPGLSTSLASFSPWGRSISDSGKLRCEVFDSYVDLGRGVKGCRGEVEAFGFRRYNVAVYRRPALSRHVSSTLALCRRGGSNLEKLCPVVRALIAEISVISVGEGRGDLSVVDYRVSVTVTSPGRFPLGCD
jgi:hypothetical protein